jgi:hypothetical protein
MNTYNMKNSYHIPKKPQFEAVTKVQEEFVNAFLKVAVPNYVKNFDDKLAEFLNTRTTNTTLQLILPEKSDLPDLIDRWMIFVKENGYQNDYTFFQTHCASLFQDEIDWQSASIISLYECKRS